VKNPDDDEPVIATVSRWIGYVGIALALGWALFMVLVVLVTLGLKAWDTT
jgi:hypothetical protein